MPTVVGLFEQRPNLDKAIAELRQAKFGPEDMVTLDSAESVRRRLDCSFRRKIFEEMLFMATLSAVVFGLFGLLAGLGSIRIGATTGWAAATTFVFTLLGVSFGVFIGAWLGRGDAEQDIHLYLEGVRGGGVLLMVQVDEERLNKVTATLRRHKAIGISLCTRLRRLERAALPA